MKLQTLLLGIITSLMMVVSCSSETDEAAKNQVEWTNLLKGDSLALWKSSKGDTLPAGWDLKEGILHFKKVSKSRGSHLLTKKDYFDFELKFDFQVAKASNSGVKYRTTENLALEYQVIDDVDCEDIKKPAHSGASVYDIVPAADSKKLYPAGEWNSGRIVAHGNKIEHWLNGEKVIDIERGSEEWVALFKKSKYRDNEAFATSPGVIMLQDHGDEVSYRNLFIREIKSAE